MYKKILFVFLSAILIFSSQKGVFASELDSLQSLQKVPNEILEVDFSKEPTDKEKKLLKKYYITDAEKIFNDDFATKLFERDSTLLNTELDKKYQNEVFMKEQVFDRSAILSRASASLGTYGDILVAYSFSSFGIDVAAVGHAAIVHNDSSKTIESFPNGGVRVYNNDWGAKSKVYGVRVTEASLSDYKNAASYALSQAHAQKPYNWNFFNKGTTNSFYCSQLVWRSWKNQGYEVDRMNLGNWEPVSPAELVGGSETYVFYKN